MTAKYNRTPRRLDRRVGWADPGASREKPDIVRRMASGFTLFSPTRNAYASVTNVPMDSPFRMRIRLPGRVMS